MIDSDCIFCKIIRGDIPCAKIYETPSVLAFLDIAPIRPGHTLVIPKAHHPDLWDLPDETGRDLLAALKTVGRAVVHATGAGGCNLVMNNGPRPGRSWSMPIFHLIPRVTGDGSRIVAGRLLRRRPGHVPHGRGHPVPDLTSARATAPGPGIVQHAPEDTMSGKTLTKADIVDYIYEKTERNRAEVKVLVDHLLDIMKQSNKKDDSLLVSGFGKFEAYHKRARKGRNPRRTKHRCCRRARWWSSPLQKVPSPSSIPNRVRRRGFHSRAGGSFGDDEGPRKSRRAHATRLGPRPARRRPDMHPVEPFCRPPLLEVDARAAVSGPAHGLGQSFGVARMHEGPDLHVKRAGSWRNDAASGMPPSLSRRTGWCLDMLAQGLAPA
jgi:histidine triad (HIT) family protein